MAFTPVPSALDLVELEARVLERWREQDAFRESLRRREGAPEWVFYEGPPTANARPLLVSIVPRLSSSTDSARNFKAMWKRGCVTTLTQR